MKRKVSLIGPSTLMVSLPSKWVHENKVKKGDEIEVTLKGKELIISKETKTQDKKSVYLEEKQLGKIHKNILAFLYHKGCDEVKINFKDDSSKKALLAKIDELIGFEIVNETDSSITIKSVIEMKSEEFDNILRRTFILLQEMGEKTSIGLEESSIEKLAEVVIMESTNNRQTDFCKRLLNKSGYKNSENTSLVYLIIRDLEKIADTYKALNLYYMQNTSSFDGGITKENLELLKLVNKLFRLFYGLFYKFDSQNAFEFHELHEKISKVAKHNLTSAKKAELVLLHNVLILDETIFRLYGPYYTMMV